MLRERSLLRGAQSALDFVVWRGLKPPRKHGPNVFHQVRCCGGWMGVAWIVYLPEDVAVVRSPFVQHWWYG